MRPTAAQESPVRSSGNPGVPGEDGEGEAQTCPVVPPCISSAGARVSPEISPCICQAPKTPSTCQFTHHDTECPQLSLPICPWVHLCFLPFLGARGPFPQCGWWKFLATGWAKRSPCPGSPGLLH